MTSRGRMVRLLTALAAMGLVFMGAIVLPVFLVPALTGIRALGLAGEAHPDRVPRWSRGLAGQHGSAQPD
jgi:hypothetical protein